MAQSTQSTTADAAELKSGPAGWISRAVARSWVLEISVVVALAIAYNLIRAIPHGNDITPFEHARHILALEGALFDVIEKPLNVWIDTVPVVAVAACYYYALLHYAATPIVFFMSRRRGGWQYWRGYWALIIASGTALIVYALYPLAPPRLTPGIGIVDIMREYAAYGWWGSAASAPRGIGDATNQFAAMPSMHFGWALWCGIQMWGFKTKAWRILAVAYPSILVFVVLATGNHYFLDVIGGGLCVLFGYGVVELIGRRIGARQADHAATAELVAMSCGSTDVAAPAGDGADDASGHAIGRTDQRAYVDSSINSRAAPRDDRG